MRDDHQWQNTTLDLSLIRYKSSLMHYSLKNIEVLVQTQMDIPLQSFCLLTRMSQSFLLVLLIEKHNL